MTTTTYNEQSYNDLKHQYHIDWQARKGRRTEQAAQYAREYRRLTYKGCLYIIKVAQRSHGYATDYKQVATYFILVYKDGKLINGYTKTARAWKQAEAEINKLLTQ